MKETAEATHTESAKLLIVNKNLIAELVVAKQEQLTQNQGSYDQYCLFIPRTSSLWLLGSSPLSGDMSLYPSVCYLSLLTYFF